MDENFVAVLVGVIAGALGYWFTTFWMRPILQFREIRSKIFSDLIFYAQVINADGLSERMQELYEERIVANRLRSAELEACLLEIPRWYKWWLKHRELSPERGASNLIGLSNTTNYEAAEKRVEAIKGDLGIKSDRI